MNLQLGCIADDFTGATDLANNLVRAGMRVVQTIGVPASPIETGVDAVVVALKSRTIAACDAIEQSLAAASWLRNQGAAQLYFKYCSTFDSTPAGNIGPVTEALMDAMGCDFTITTPAFPDNGRTVFQGHLFVGDVLLSDSGMKDHPLTPMRDANLVRVMQAQCRRRRVGLIDYRCVAAGAEAVRRRIDALLREGVGIAVVDALSNEDLLRLGPALKDMALVTAGSGVAIALPANFGFSACPEASALPAVDGGQAIVSGSCSQATNRQVAHFLSTGGAAFQVDPLRLAAGCDVAAQALAWAAPRLAASKAPLLVYSTAQPQLVSSAQAQLGSVRAGALVEQCIAAIAAGLVRAGVRRLIVAGGETSGACVQALGVSQLQIGPQIDPGVPWCFAGTQAAGGDGLWVALKSGNFGSEDFFTRALQTP